MKIIETALKEVKIVEPQVFGDNRGWFYESYSYEKLAEGGIDVQFVQDNRSFSAKKGTLRGLHFQKNPMSQSKLIGCTRGEILDVAVDIRKGSPTYLKWVSVKLTAENKKMLFLPKGFAHGFVTLTDDVEVFYKVDEYYSPENDRSIRYDDPSIAVEWNVENPTLSQKDINAPLLCDSDANFIYGETK
ncbi:MAG: dTDP-4-dehydrorhamnose 3,5-epimerase [Faecalibacterium sp.]|nr:dTDP-4-dehydrorhamnose 3,5-epimerase [Ruminococcus sp.]MCM1393196.1 dTDP-4-dehydrorhamnose 3,5-epimerase [Ruminococcus sp.]MCM1486648.1 dTDP-4-dehydrorhamnose 3,5-epimerase [Faecalibacterium sp.]